MNLDEAFLPYHPPKNHLVDRLRYWAAHKPNDLAFRYLRDGENDCVDMTYAELDRSARACAAFLQSKNLQGERALLLYPPGLDFLIGYFGCLYAGAVAVPAYPPKKNRTVTRIQAISQDAEAKIALTVAGELEKFDQQPDAFDEAPQLRNLIWQATDALDPALADRWQAPEIDPTDLAMLQYTSGSTGTPKGVMLTHRNLIKNCQYIAELFQGLPGGSGLTWLPLYHDMGLVGGVLKPMFIGRPNVLMSPMSFLARPVRWLRAISTYGITISGGPNFAYELCNEKIDPADCEGLDLSKWTLAFNGAEPIRSETLEKFSQKFAPYGFAHSSHYPCYGMAETTLLVTGGVKQDPPVIRTFDGPALDAKRVVVTGENDPHGRRLVGCGKPVAEERMVVVDPQTRRELPAGEVGEIWIDIPSKGLGYWHKPDITQETFLAYLADGTTGPFLRTGDLGFLDDGELFVTGRLKDLIIIRGVNRYPQDIEQTVERAHPKIQSNGAAAFAVDQAGRERLIVVCEVERSPHLDYDPLIQSVRQAVAAEHDVPPDAVVLVRKQSIPKTSSGKIQRHACKQEYLKGELHELARWTAGDAATARPTVKPGEAPPLSGTDGEVAQPDSTVVAVVLQAIRDIGQERARDLTLETNLLELGLDSLERTQIAATLEDAFGGRFPDEVLAEIETVRSVALAVERHLGPAPQKVHPLQKALNGSAKRARTGEIPESFYRFDSLPEYERLKASMRMLEAAGTRNPFFHSHESVTSATALIEGQRVINFSNYDYVGMSADPVVQAGAKAAIDRFGTSVSASRLVSGQKTIHDELERELADFLGVPASLLFSAGHATNQSTISHLMDKDDLILHDALAHNSIVAGAEASKARRRAFRHNDWQHLDELLSDLRPEYRRALVVVEGVYSMDGDFPDLARFIEVKKAHKAWLYVDEAHSLGTMGATGRGVSEAQNVDPNQVDVWMGTLSKSLGSCGGYVAGSQELIEYLKYTNPFFVFSCGISPGNVGAALAAIRQLKKHPDRVKKLQDNSKLFLRLAREAGLNTGSSEGTAVVPVITGSSMLALELSQTLREQGVHAMPILYPAVADEEARVRFFISSMHTEDQIRTTVEATADSLDRLRRRDSQESEPAETVRQG